jgi:F0F1-type ATP synthase assembly protein I
MSPQSEEQKKQWNITGVAIPGGVLIGLGVGFLIDNIVAGLFLGLGGGFLIMMIAMLIFQIRK